MENTLENNKLIAEFMGLTPNPFDDGKTVGINAFQHENGDWLADKWEVSKYHTSWDWLMPVCRKIMAMLINYPKELKDSIIYGVTMFDLSYTWRAVTQFVIWYNNQYN